VFALALLWYIRYLEGISWEESVEAYLGLPRSEGGFHGRGVRSCGASPQDQSIDSANTYDLNVVEKGSSSTRVRIKLKTKYTKRVQRPFTSA